MGWHGNGGFAKNRLGVFAGFVVLVRSLGLSSFRIAISQLQCDNLVRTEVSRKAAISTMCCCMPSISRAWHG